MRISSLDLPAAEAPSAAPTAAPAAAAPTLTPAPAPAQPLQLYLDLSSSLDALDAVVCDADGLAVPGYAFPLEIRYQDGSTHSVLTDVNGHYYAEYILPGEYRVSMPELEGFLPAESASCTVVQKKDSVTVENFGSFSEGDELSDLPEDAMQSGAAHAAVSEIEGLDAALPPDEGGNYHYRYSVGENGYLLLADGTESDVLPVENRGELSYGVRMRTVYHLLDGTVVQPEALPDDAVLWTDYYTDEKAVAVPLILGGGAVDKTYAVTAEWVDPSSVRRTGWVEENGRSYYYAADGRPVSGLKNIDGRLYFFDGSGAKASSLGIDVSYFNSTVDWRAVKAAGIDFAIIRVAYRTWEKGILNEDEDSYRQGKNGGFYLQDAKAAGLQVGVYVYSTAVTTDEAVEEAALALEIVKKAGVELDLPIYFDCEFSGAYPKGRADRLSMVKRAEIAKAFCETVEKAGYRAGVYSNEDFFNRALQIQFVSDYDIWYASYTRGFALPTFRGFDIWQFSESVRVNGMPDSTDINVIF
jgi:GH25 family lysozyme M1 (1,4-beta-N-acetylmuramidase)